jgi:hypothetical protein
MRLSGKIWLIRAVSSARFWVVGAFVVLAMLTLVATPHIASASGGFTAHGGAGELAQAQSPLVKQFTEAEVNRYFLAILPLLKPVEGMQLRFVPGQVQAEVRAYGVSGTVYSGLAVRDGRIVTVNPQVYGFLGWFVSGATAAPYLERQINTFANPYGTYLVTDVQVQNQAVTVKLLAR